VAEMAVFLPFFCWSLSEASQLKVVREKVVWNIIIDIFLKFVNTQIALFGPWPGPKYDFKTQFCNSYCEAPGQPLRLQA